MTFPLLEASHISFNVNAQKCLLNEISFHLNANDRLAILGPSGSGKTTLAHLLKGHYIPSQGEFIFRGQSTQSKELLVNPLIQLIYQHPDQSLTPRRQILSVLVEYLTKYQNLTQQVAFDLLHDLCNQLRISFSHLQKSPHQLSGGEKQRVALLRALLPSPSLLICDEILSAIDEPLQVEIIRSLINLQQSNSFAFVMITHDLGLVLEHFDSVLLIERGEQLYFGSTQNLIEQRDSFEFIDQSLKAMEWLEV